MNENINLVLDQILKQLEELKKVIIRKEPDKVENEDSLSVISERLRNIEEYGPLVNTNIANFSNSFGKLVDRINSYEPVNETKVEYNHVFFPGIQSWLHSFKRGLVIIILLFVISGLTLTSFFLWKKMDSRKDEYYKYHTMRYSGQSIEFADSIYNSNRINLINRLDSLIAEDEKEARLKDELTKTVDKYHKIQRELENTN